MREQDSFLLHSIALCSDSVRRRQVNPRKVYPVDTGLMALFELSGKPNTGHALETAVLHHLLRQGASVSYVHTPSGYEVDFCAQLPTGETWLVQVCLDLTDNDTLQREVRALQDTPSQWPNARRMLVSLSAPAVLALPPGIEHHRATTWLLTP